MTTTKVPGYVIAFFVGFLAAAILMGLFGWEPTASEIAYTVHEQAGVVCFESRGAPSIDCLPINETRLAT